LRRRDKPGKGVLLGRLPPVVLCHPAAPGRRGP
jgi:hypothetical protein